jgi:hypothetical protein
METTVTKKTLECYSIRANKTWAEISLDCGNKSGRLQIASDYGSWQYYWGAAGVPFKEFLLGLNIQYTAGKFGESRWFDHEATMKELRELVAAHDNEEEKEAMTEELEELEDCTDSNSFQHIAYNADTLHKLWDTGPNIHTDISPSFRHFWDKLWSVFIDELKKEAIAE